MTSACRPSEESDPFSWDIDPAAEPIPFEDWCSLDGVAKLRLASDMALAVQRKAMARLAARYPSDSEENLRLREACLRYGRDVVERCTGRRLRW